MCYAVLGETSKCNDGIKELESYLTTELVEKAFIFLILVNALLSNDDKVIDYLEQAYKKHLPLVLLLNPSPVLKSIKNNKCFKDIMTKAIVDNNNYKSSKKYKQTLLTTQEVEKYSKELKKLMSGNRNQK